MVSIRGMLTMTRCQRTGVVNKKIWVHLMYMDACFLSSRRGPKDSDNRNAGKMGLVKIAGRNETIINLVYADA